MAKRESKSAAQAIAHDRDLFQTLVAEARRLGPDVRVGSMFGCPAVFQGRKLAACVYGDGVGLRIPEAIATASLQAGRARAFRPHGKPAMREWIQIDGGAAAIAASLDLLAAAIAFAAANNG